MRAIPLFFAICAALAQDATRAGKLASVEGVVVNAVTNEPVVRAHVTLTPDSAGMTQKFGAMTNAEGNFSILQMPAGSYTATAEHVGYVAAESAVASKTKVVLQPGDKQPSATVKLIPLGAISGRVVGADGEPLESVQVYAEHASRSTEGSITDERGVFRIGGLAPGNYRVRAGSAVGFGPPEVRTDGTRQVHYIPAYYPSSPTARTATRVHISAGAEAGGIEIQLRTGPIVRVSGKVTNPLGPGLRGIWINWSDGASLSTSFRADGSFDIWGLNPGRYSLITHGEIIPGVPVSVSQPVEIEVGDSNIDGVRLTPMPPLVVSGRLVYEEDGAKPKSSAETPLVLLEELRTHRIRGEGIAEDGSVRLDNIWPERFRVMLSWPGGYVKSMRLGETEIDGGILDLGAATGGPLEIRVSSVMGAVSGTVHTDDQAAPGMIVALISDNPADPEDASVARFTTSTSDGSYSFDPIPPGRYKLAAVNERETRTIDDIEDYGDAVQTVEVHEREKLSRDLKWSEPHW